MKWTCKALATMGVTLALVGMVMAQVQPRQNRGRLRNQGGEPLKKVRPQPGDPLVNAAGAIAKGKNKGVQRSRRLELSLHIQAALV